MLLLYGILVKPPVEELSPYYIHPPSLGVQGFKQPLANPL